MHPESADAAAPTRLPSIVMSFPSPSPSCHACPLFLHFAAPREKTHTYTRARTVHVHARDARRAKRRAKESAPRRPELSRSHGSSSGSGGDIPTYLPIGPEPACRKRLSVSFSHLSLSFSLYLSLILVTSVYFSYSTLFFHLTPTHRTLTRAREPQQQACTRLVRIGCIIEIMINSEVNAKLTAKTDFI